MDSPRITFTARADATAETELNTLALVYRFILDCKAQKENAGRAPKPDSCDDHESLVNEGRRLT